MTFPGVVLAMLACVWVGDAERGDWVQRWRTSETCAGGYTGADASDCVQWYKDADGDGHGGAESRCVCAAGDDYVAPAFDDCDDLDPGVHAGAAEVCDGIDDDCDANTTDVGLVTIDGDLSTFESVQEAIDAASARDTIRVCQGEYLGDLIIPRSLTLVGIDGAAATTLRGTGTSTVVTVTGGAVTLQGVTITGGTGSDWSGTMSGAGVWAQDGTGLTVIDSVISGNTAIGYGGGILSFVPLTVAGTEISDNGGAGGGGGVYQWNYPFNIEDSRIFGNTGACGAGILSWGAELILNDTRIYGNAGDRGGGLCLQGPVTVTGGVVTGNQSITGAGVEADWPDDTAVVLHNVRVNANLAMSGGGAIHVWNGTAECDECDLGEGVEDNAPQDVLAAGTDFCFGDGVSFQCSATAGCTTDEAQDCTAE